MTAPTTTRLTPLRGLAIRFGNPITKRFAGRLPGFGILVYRGRTSGRPYRTPINVFRHGDEMVFALTYGPDVQWVKNVQAAGVCTIRSRERDITLVDPVLFADPGRRSVPLLVRWFLARIGVAWFLRMRITSPDAGVGPTPPGDRGPAG